MWTDHLKLGLTWVLFFGTIVFTATVGDIVVVALLFGLIGIIGTMFLTIHVTYDWLEVYITVKTK